MTRPLTPYQYKIASLVADALNNQQIAESLGITTVCANSNIIEIYTRLGIPPAKLCNPRVRLAQMFWEGQISLMNGAKK